MTLPKWAEDNSLKLVGKYYEGFVTDVELVKQQHQADTVCTFGVRRSRYSKQSDNQSGNDIEVNHNNKQCQHN